MVALTWWFFLFCLWLLFVEAAPPSELWTGALAALISAMLATLAGEAVEVRFRPKAGWLAEVRWLPLRLVTDTAAVLRMVVRRLRRHAVHGRYVALPAPVKAADARTCARRFLLTEFISFTPNTIVVAFDQDQGYVIVHELARLGRGRRPRLPVWL